MVFYLKHLVNLKIRVQQGGVINGCIAENYKGKVYGMIMAPRCDIGNEGKVSTVHYLPIVSFVDWVKVDCLRMAMFKKI